MPNVELIIDRASGERIVVPFAPAPELGGMARSSGRMVQLSGDAPFSECASAVIKALGEYKLRTGNEPSEFYSGLPVNERESILTRSVRIHIVTIPAKGFGKAYTDLDAPPITRFLLPLSEGKLSEIVELALNQH
jgi:hypothetical protein